MRGRGRGPANANFFKAGAASDMSGDVMISAPGFSAMHSPNDVFGAPGQVAASGESAEPASAKAIEACLRRA